MSKVIECHECGNRNLCFKETWTSGAKSLRNIGFTVYPKAHKAFIGRMYHGGLYEASIEVTHDRQTGKWEFEFHSFLGKRDFSIEKTKKIVKCGVYEVQSDFDKFKQEFADEYSAQIKIIRNIFIGAQD